jgi:lactate dehydrogenase-like 2-hydroxyacid dehydrogenase
MARVLQVGRLLPALAETLRTTYEAPLLPDGSEREAFLAEHGAEVEVVVTSGSAGVPTALMAALPSLRAVVSFGVGFDRIDTATALERGILISNTPDVLTDCVADTALALTLDVLRGTSAADRFVRRGDWAAGSAFPLTRRVSGKHVGILGLGRIGQAIATRFEGFGCSISYHSRREVAGTPYSYVASPGELAREVDILVVATAGGGGTARLVDRSVLEALGPRGFLVNISRGSVVDEDALVDLLTTGGLAGAGLDVFASEPHVPEVLLGLDNVVLLPHLASATVETRAAMARVTLDNLDRYLDDGTLLTPVAEVSR